MRRPALLVLLAALVLGAAPVAARAQAVHLPPLPDSTGWGVHILALARAPDGAIWVGTYGDGIFVYRPGARETGHPGPRTTNSVPDGCNPDAAARAGQAGPAVAYPNERYGDR